MTQGCQALPRSVLSANVTASPDRGSAVPPHPTAPDDLSATNQGLTLVHFSAQPERFRTQNTP